jgi:hypothetical protein
MCCVWRKASVGVEQWSVERERSQIFYEKQKLGCARSVRCYRATAPLESTARCQFDVLMGGTICLVSCPER